MPKEPDFVLAPDYDQGLRRRVKSLQVVDWDGDGDVDLVGGLQYGRVGTEENVFVYWERLPNGSFAARLGAANPFEGVKHGGKGFDVQAVDWDGDVRSAYGALLR